MNSGSHSTGDTKSDENARAVAAQGGGGMSRLCKNPGELFSGRKIRSKTEPSASEQILPYDKAASS